MAVDGEAAGCLGNVIQRLELPLSGWTAAAITYREGCALLVFDEDRLVDAVLAAAAGRALLRAARCRPADSRAWSLAWGQLPCAPGWVEVAFQRRAVNRPSPAVRVAERFWLAETPGAYPLVTVSTPHIRMTGQVVAARESPQSRSR